MTARSNGKAVFINCPFDPEFLPIFQAVLFTVCSLGFEPRSALEYADSSALRLEKIYALIQTCPYAIHDLSRTELDSRTELPRFNMPLELGIFLGAKRFGSPAMRKKKSAIFAKKEHVKSFISDINGLDIWGHDDQANNVIAPIRHWLCNDARATRIPASMISDHFSRFSRELPEIFERLGYGPGEAKYGDILTIIADWLESHPLKVFRTELA